MQKSMGQQIVSAGKSKTFPVLLSVHYCCYSQSDHHDHHPISISVVAGVQFIVHIYIFCGLSSIVRWAKGPFLFVCCVWSECIIFIGLLFVVKSSWVGYLCISPTRPFGSIQKEERQGGVFTTGIRRNGKACPIAAGVGNRVNSVWLYGPQCPRSTWGVWREDIIKPLLPHWDC